MRPFQFHLKLKAQCCFCIIDSLQIIIEATNIFILTFQPLFAHMRRLSLLLICFTVISLQAQKKQLTIPVVNVQEDSTYFSQTKFRQIGPYRGGRSAAVCGSYRDINTFYMGATGGGVWKTTDGGSNWKNISDKYFGGSIGSIAVSEMDENIIYVGEGENTMRGNVSEGINGMWKSADGGRTWSNTGLKNARHITNILIHPRNTDIVWVSVQGHLFGPSDERGVYKTIDGGKNWRKVLYSGHAQAGAIDLVMEPGNPNILYASTWNVIRTPYSLESGGNGSALWKSTDGGETWTNLMNKKGMPQNEIIGIIGITVSATNPQKLYALIESNSKGLYSSDDGGEHWKKITDNADLCQRSWYFSKLFCDPKDERTLYVLNVGMYRSRDGGHNWEEIYTPHGDHHDLWIDPANPNRMVVGDDGGAQVSFDAGANWSTYYNQPTAQFYRVSTDNSFPYRILGAQQDNSTVRIRSRSIGGSITEADWEETAGSESGYVVADPLNPDIVYGGNYQGYLSRYDHKTDENRSISVWPVESLGDGVIAAKYRFQWNFPIFFSPHNPRKLYAAGNMLFATENEGQSWKAISGDLTTNDTSKQKSSGGPITKDNTSVEYYCTVFTAAECVLEKDVLWTGSDDGLIHISRDGGNTWKNVTPPEAPKWMMWNCIETSPYDKGTAYFAGTKYKSDDFAPYLFKTTDYGKTWQRINNGIPALHFTRAIRADRKKKGLLYCGTEYGLYISYDDGANWKSFQLNLPLVPITDITIKNNDLIIATQGRSFWVLDDLTTVQQKMNNVTKNTWHVYNPVPVYRSEGYVNERVGNNGTNPPNGVVLQYWLNEEKAKDTIQVAVYNNKSELIQIWSPNAKKQEDQLHYEAGMNKLVWNLEYPSTEKVDNLIMWNGAVISGLKVTPGKYTVRFKSKTDSIDVEAEVLANPNNKMTQADYEAQVNFLLQVKNKFNDIQKTIKQIRSLREQINGFTAPLDTTKHKEVLTLADSIQTGITRIEEALYQTKARSPQDVLNYPIRINDQMASIYYYAASGNTAPAQQAYDAFKELSALADKQLSAFKALQENELQQLNKLIHQKLIPVISVNEED